jgi:NitT/TauT family transport system permease protein
MSPQQHAHGVKAGALANSLGLSWHTAQITIFFLAIFLLWEGAVRLFEIKSYLLPPPTAILSEGWQSRQLLFDSTIVTLGETLLGFAVGVVTGAALAVLVFSMPLARTTVYPLLVALQSIPKAAMAPLLIVWFGYGISSKIVMSYLIAFFPIVISTLGGLSSTPPNLLEHFRALGASNWNIFWHLRFPSALPYFIDGCKVAIPLAVIGAVIGEFVGSESGLGNLIMLSSASQRTALTFAALLVVTALSMLLFAVVEAVGWLVWWRSR